MNYKELVEYARSVGNWNEKTMWKSVCSMAKLLGDINKEHPQMFWDFLREQHGILFGMHYHEDFAVWDVAQIECTDKEGKKHKGAYWTVEQIEQATKDKTFPSGTTKWDKFVAYNVFWSDTCKVLSDEQILKGAYQFYFADEDFGKDRGSKIWNYMAMVYDKD